MKITPVKSACDSRFCLDHASLVSWDSQCIALTRNALTVEPNVAKRASRNLGTWSATGDHLNQSGGGRQNRVPPAQRCSTEAQAIVLKLNKERLLSIVRHPKGIHAHHSPTSAIDAKVCEMKLAVLLHGDEERGAGLAVSRHDHLHQTARHRCGHDNHDACLCGR